MDSTATPASSWSVCIRLPACMTKAPMPRSAPIISAATTSRSAIEAEIRKPDRMPGSAPGRSTLRTTSANGTPKLCAMRTRLRGTSSIAAKVATAIGKNTPSAIVATLEDSPMPSHRIRIGMIAIFGIGKRALTPGMPIERAIVERPIATPSATPPATPIGPGSSTGFTHRIAKASCHRRRKAPRPAIDSRRFVPGAKPPPRKGIGVRKPSRVGAARVLVLISGPVSTWCVLRGSRSARAPQDEAIWAGNLHRPHAEVRSSSQFRGEPQPERFHHPQDSSELGISLLVERFVQTFAGHPGLGSDPRHAACASDIAERRGDKRGVAVVERCVDIGGNRFIAVQELGRVPRLRRESHRSFLLFGERPGLADVAGLRPLVAAAQQDDERLAAADEIDSVTGPIIDPELGDPSADRLRVAEVAERKAPDSNVDSSLRLPVAKPIEPFRIDRRLPNLEHKRMYPIGYGSSKPQREPLVSYPASSRSAAMASSRIWRQRRLCSTARSAAAASRARSRRGIGTSTMSLIRPGRRESTTTRSASRTASSRLWVM